ncbi:pyridoxal phosphate-dependent decarboxylase family protein [Glacieibacterium frigidum]|uniref:Aspartate aminotransferase family protein n=1 Tax=Glacieibacterium frigidum TaxID=2593303 RepID=A0A552UGX2_9SPHN|nr:pyridoxal-dependent decarboxylase [Glacieibacterium frigidum]TRW17427.1 aspartate aminotransferase family protein [Glacieibacterium frigidum]
MTDDSSWRAMERAVAAARVYIDGLDSAPVGATVDLATLRARLDTGLPATGVAPDRVIDELVAATEGGHNASTGGRFFAWVIGGALPAALAADWLTAAWDENAGMYSCAPAASVAEEVAGAWLKDVLGLPASASFALTTGCQMAHVTALAAARHALLAARGWDVEADGLNGAPPIAVLANAQRHHSLDRALRLLGIGSRAVVPLATGDDDRVRPETLAAALAERGGLPTIVALNAADLNIGACDDFATLIPIARAAGAWVHVDGAFGLWAAASPRLRAHVAGVELADSWATDAHKWLNTPYDCGIAVVRDAAAHRAAMTVSASYLVVDGGARDAIDWTPEFSRRGRGYIVYAALRELGRDGLAALFDRCCDHAAALAHGVAALPGAALVGGPGLNQALVRFTGADGADCTDAVIARVNAGGEAFFSGTLYRGRRAMRISVCNWRTSDADVARAVAAVAAAL